MKQETKWTPGPWEAEKMPSGDWVVRTIRGYRGQHEANARLIAAAPELYEALQQMNIYFGSMAGACEQESEDAIKQCRAALAKARGEA